VNEISIRTFDLICYSTAEPVKALSGQEILDALITVTDITGSRGLETLMTDWILTPDKYGKFVRSIASQLGLREYCEEHHHEPFNGYSTYHHQVSKDTIEDNDKIVWVDKRLFDYTNEADIRVNVYYVGYNLTDSPRYFYKGDLPTNIADRKMPRIVERTLQMIYESYLRKLGYKEINDVEDDIAQILSRKKITPDDSPLNSMDTPNPTDLFLYRGRMFSLTKKRTTTTRGVMYSNENDARHPTVCLGISVHAKGKLLGYVNIKDVDPKQPSELCAIDKKTFILNIF